MAGLCTSYSAAGLPDILRALQSGWQPVRLIVLGARFAEMVKSQIDECGVVPEHGVDGPLTSWQIKGVPVAVADVTRPFLIREGVGGFPLVEYLA